MVMGYRMCKLLLQSFCHSGLVSVTRVLLKIKGRISDKYKLHHYIQSDKLKQIKQQFKFNDVLLPSIPDRYNYFLILSNQFRMGIPVGYNIFVDLPVAHTSIVAYRNSFVFQGPNYVVNVNLWFIYENLCLRLYNSWLLGKYNVSLVVSRKVLNPWSVQYYAPADSKVSNAIELNNLHYDASFDSRLLTNSNDVLKRQIQLLTDTLRMREYEAKHGVTVPADVYTEMLDPAIGVTCVLSDSEDFSDAETLELNPGEAAVTFNGMFVWSRRIISYDYNNGEYLINRILCYVDCEDTEWNRHYLVCYWHDMHISTYEHRDDVPGGCQEYWWSLQSESNVKTEMIQYLDTRREKEIKKYIRSIKQSFRDRGGSYRKHITNIDIREYESAALLKCGVRNPWMKNTICPSSGKDVLSMEVKWQDREMQRFSKLQDKLQKENSEKVYEKLAAFGGFSLFLAAGEELLDTTSTFCEVCLKWIDEEDVENHGCLQLCCYKICCYL